MCNSLRKNNPLHTYLINDYPIKSANAERDLGITVDNKLVFDSHVTALLPKLYSLARRFFLTFKSRSPKIYSKLFVYLYPILVYGLPVWYPRFNKDLNKLCKFLNYYSKLVYIKCKLQHEKSMCRLNRLHIPTLNEIFLRAGLAYMYKVLHNLVDKPSYFPSLKESRNRGYSLKLSVPFCNGELRKSFFCVRLISTWNSLPDYVVSSSSLTLFKSFLRSLHLSEPDA